FVLLLFFFIFYCWYFFIVFFFSSRRRHTRSKRDWSSDVCSSDLIGVFQQMIVGNGGEVVKLEIVDVHRKPLFDVLLDVVVYDGVGFSRAGSTKYNRGSKWVDDINPTVIPFAFIIELRRKIDGVFIFHQTGFLPKTLVFIIENIVHQIVAE